MAFKRNIEKRFKDALSTSPAVLLTGARQTGKTTLVEEYAKERDYQYVTFDDLTLFATARRDPQGFIKNLSKPVIIDEVQRVPEIFLPIKRDIDTHRKPGRYILTGSANPLLINKTGESLAGRLETLTLFPFSQGELRNTKEDFIETLFDAKAFARSKETISKEKLYELITIGGYPNVQKLTQERRLTWFAGYINDILLKDVQNLARIEALAELPNLLKFISFRAGHILNVTDVARLIGGLSSASAHRYTTLLETLYLINFCKPWRAGLEKRLVKSPKVYLTDTGILCFLQGVTAQRLLDEPTLSGHILENFIWQELSKQATWSTLRVEILHFRTATGIEVDIVLEDAQGRVVGIEVKNSNTIRYEDFDGLIYLQKLLGKKFVRGIVFYPGNEVVPFGNNLFAVPITHLWR